MRSAISMLGFLLLTACQTPPAVVDTAGQLSKLTAVFDAHLSDYVSQSNAGRARDARSIALIEQQTEPDARVNQYELDVMQKRDADRDREVLRLLALPEPTPTDPQAILRPRKTVARTEADLMQKFGLNTYDRKTLTGLAQSAGALANPRDLLEQLQSAASFAKTVYDDVKSSAAKTPVQKK